MSQPKPGGQGPEAVTGATYSEIQKEIEGRTHRKRFSDATPPTLPTVPVNPANVWNEVDREPDPPVEDE